MVGDGGGSVGCPACGEPNPGRARFCLACGGPLPSPAVRPGGSRRAVTVVFSDLSGSTTLGERLDPESLSRVMTRYYETMRAVVHHHGGTVEKFAGDAVMAVFGIPAAHEDDALRAVRAAADMHAAQADLNRELWRRWRVRLELHTGVNTGEVVAGDPGVGGALVVGDAVNLAAGWSRPPGPVTSCSAAAPGAWSATPSRSSRPGSWTSPAAGPASPSTGCWPSGRGRPAAAAGSTPRSWAGTRSCACSSGPTSGRPPSAPRPW